MADEKRLIDANALNWRASQKRMEEFFPNWKELPQEVKDMLCKHGKEFERLLKEAPTVDAVEVVHGEWVLHQEDGYEWYECSSCKSQPLNDNAERPVLSDYCHNCGAKMDGGNEDGK